MSDTGITFIFDMDDLLIRTSHFYAASIVKTAKEIVKNKHEISELDKILSRVETEMLSPEDAIYLIGKKGLIYAKKFVEIHADIDNEMMRKAKHAKFGRKRFPTSLANTYKHYSPGCSRKEWKNIYAIGDEVFDRVSPVLENVESVLDFLKEKKDRIVVLTKGDLHVQKKRAKDANLEKWFDNRIYVVDYKTPFEFQRVLDSERTPTTEKVFSVGNFYAADIKPALKQGIKGLYIPDGKYFREKDIKDCLILDNILRIKNNYEQITYDKA